MARSKESARGPGQRAGLTKERVLDEAKRLVASDGVEGLTMRALAERLSVAPNALYSHVADKSALLDGLLDHVLADIETDDLKGKDWRGDVTELMRRSRRLLLEHAELLPHLLSRPTRGPNAIRLGETTLDLLSRAGLGGSEAAEALQVLLVQTFGSAALEAPRRLDPDSEGRRRAAVAAFRGAEGRPRMAALAEPLSQAPTDSTFETGLRWLLDGIAQAGKGGDR